MAKRIVRRRSTTEKNTAETTKPTPEPVVAASDRKTPQRRKPALEPTDENVRLAAYYRYLDRAETDGDALGDWVEAERSLKRR